jgi:hypothetical protein
MRDLSFGSLERAKKLVPKGKNERKIETNHEISIGKLIA